MFKIMFMMQHIAIIIYVWINKCSTCSDVVECWHCMTEVRRQYLLWCNLTLMNDVFCVQLARAHWAPYSDVPHAPFTPSVSCRLCKWNFFVFLCISCWLYGIYIFFNQQFTCRTTNQNSLYNVSIDRFFYWPSGFSWGFLQVFLRKYC